MLALYADDSAYFASSRRADLAAKKIQRVLDLLPEWLDKWRMTVNVSKTAALLTGSQRNMPDQLRLRGQAVEWNTRVRYLGVYIAALIANDSTSRPRHPDESGCARQTAADTRLQTAHKYKSSNLQVLHTLPPDLRCTGLVCPLLGTAAPASPGPAKHSAPPDCGGRVVRQKRRHRQRPGSRDHRGVRQKILQRNWCIGAQTLPPRRLLTLADPCGPSQDRGGKKYFPKSNQCVRSLGHLSKGPK
ncbi:hypothetical protein EVAR_9508_1 [Eumeta japonica]|uniref:Reverse transcriptase domain-containing protein n=1 Tax=Eumeta variegata TaxID=151549 RepID=A0A4C1U3R6_EUMVA|nr:hypothetical protein EVAR_9508_1 [Eumeta japonica]